MKRMLAAMAVVVLSLAASAWAEDFSKGSFSLQVYSGYASDLTNRDVRTASGTVGVGYYVFDGVGLNLEMTGCYVDEPGPQTYGGGIHLLLRHHLIRRGNWSFFLDVGPGVMQTERNVPPDGTQFNITFRSGPGITYRLDQRLHLIAGARYCHWSNAEIEGSDRNPTVNGVEGYVGLMFTF